MLTTRIGRLSRHPLFSPWYNFVVTAVLGLALGYFGVKLLRWATWESTVLPDGASSCLVATGACWSIVQQKWRFVLIGFFPDQDIWRALLSLAVLAVLLLAIASRRMALKTVVFVCLLCFVGVIALLDGRPFDLEVVGTEQWGGLLLTLLLMLGTIGLGFPFGILLAFGRRSTIPAIRSLSTVYIELIRGVPLITVLFMASVVFPLLLPAGFDVVKMVRAMIGIALCFAAYLAEAIRGGLSSIPETQLEAARSLGLKEWQIKTKVLLPQAIVIASQPVLGTFLDFFKGTSLVSIIGLFDLLGATKVALTDPKWNPFFVEMYLYSGAIYFLICFGASRFVASLETSLSVRKQR